MNKKIAVARPITINVYDVTYPGHRHGDSNVTYEDQMRNTDKKDRERLRMELPNCVETKMVVTGNLRAWREFLDKRLSPDADAEIRQLAYLILAELQEIAPHVFADYN